MKSPKTFFIGDTHIGHRKIIEFSPERKFNTIEEHDEAIITAWNLVVTPIDKVFHLGDVFFRKENIEQAKRLNGRKFLIMGNHDTYWSATEYEKVFERCYGGFAFNDCILTHVPVHPNQLDHRFKFNIHGHLHSHNLQDSRYINVSAEQLPNLAPVSWEYLKENFMKNTKEARDEKEG